jgi:hypothetical protein
MVPSLLARVDGLPVTLLGRGVVWPIPSGERNERGRSMSPARRARIERQTAVVHAAVVSGCARAILHEAATESPYLEAEAERSEIRALLAQRGVL